MTTWLLLLASTVLALGGWLWSRRHRSIRGGTLVVGRLAEDCGTVWKAGDPVLVVTAAGGRRVRVHLGAAPIEARWPRRPRLVAGCRIAVEAVAVATSREEAGYRENAQGSRLEAARVWIGAPPTRSFGPLTLALVPLLLLGVTHARERPFDLECPRGSPQIVARPGGGWIGSCSWEHVLHGPWVEIDRRWVRLVQGEHCDGERCGRWSWRAPSGTLLEEGRYLRGRRTGLWRRFNASGRMESEGRYRDGLQDGAWRFWGPRGERLEHFAAGWPTGERCEVRR